MDLAVPMLTLFTPRSAEFFNLNQGSSWGVGHYLLKGRN